MYFSPPSFNPGGNKSIVLPLILHGSLRVRCWIITQIHIFMPIPLLSAANLSAGKKEKGKHLVFLCYQRADRSRKKAGAGDGCVSLCGLLRAIVLSYLLETACTVTASSGRPCLFVFDLLGAPRSALGPQVNMHGFQIKAGPAGCNHTSWNDGTAVGEERLFCPSLK